MDEAGKLQGAGEANYSKPCSLVTSEATIHLHEDEEG